MDTQEIYQGTSLMMTEVTTSFPPATDLAYEVVGDDIVLNWVEPLAEGLVGFNVYHAYNEEEFEVLAFVDETTYTHIDPYSGLQQYYITAVYVTEESEPSNTVEILITSIGEDISPKIELFPNPASDRLNIKSPAVINDVMIYNHMGQLVNKINTSSKIVNLNISDLDTGVYIFKILTEKGLIVKQIIVE